MQRLAQLIDERGALRDQADLIVTELPQFADDGIEGAEHPPAVAIEPQGIGKAPRVAFVVLDAGGRMAVAVARRSARS